MLGSPDAMPKPLSQADYNEQAREPIRMVFQKWDTHHTGIIPRDVLLRLLKKLMKWDQADLDVMMSEIEKRGDESIHYDDFIDWMMQAGQRPFDLADVLLPLFRVYDRSGDGVITAEEFAECHSILQGSLRLHPVMDDSLRVEKQIREADVEDLFATIDDNKDKSITFDEFVRWQQKALENRAVPDDEFAELVRRLSESLRHIFHIDAAAKEGYDHGEDTLQQLIEQVADDARRLWQQKPKTPTGRPPKHPEYKNSWEEPPVGLSLERLLRVHVQDVALRTFGVQSCNADVRLCVPQVPSEMDGTSSRLWYAKVLRTMRVRDSSAYGPHGELEAELDRACTADQPMLGGNGSARMSYATVDKSEFYYYVFHDMLWTRLDDPEPFDHAVAELSPMLRLFCLLKTEANMGIKLRWPKILEALNDGAEMGLLTNEDVKRYTWKMQHYAQSLMQEDGRVKDMAHEEVKKATDRLLTRKLLMAPRHVMAGLCEIGAIEMSNLFEDFMDEQDSDSDGAKLGGLAGPASEEFRTSDEAGPRTHKRHRNSRKTLPAQLSLSGE